jgi:alpha-beta hydrolase superfamily lysophospholipase
MLLSLAAAACAPAYRGLGPAGADPAVVADPPGGVPVIEAAAADAILPLPDRLPPGTPPAERPVAVVEEAELVASDGLALPMRVWKPADGPPRAALVALHGLNDYSHAFAIPGRVWAARGIAVYAYDQRGFGANPEAGRWPGTAAMIADARAALAAVRARHPEVPLFLLGESMGGAIAMAALTAPTPAAAPEPPAVDGLILVAPAAWARETMPWPQRAALWVATRLAPALELTGEGLGIEPTDNMEVWRGLAEDPLVLKANRVDMLAGVVDMMDRGLAAADALPGRGLVLFGANEDVLPPAAVEALTERLDDTRFRRVEYPEGWHMLLRDRAAAVPIADIAAWILDPGGPLPSALPAPAETAARTATAPADAAVD